MMDIQNIIYELLYLGIRTEVHKRWKSRNKKILRKHIFALNELQKCLHTSDIDTSRTVIKKFIEDCGMDYGIDRSCPTFSDAQIDKAVMGEEAKKINQLIKEMFADLIMEIKKFYIKKVKITNLLHVMKCFLGEYLGKERRWSGWTQESVPELWALTIAASAMSDEMRKKYLHEERYLNFISDKIFRKVDEDCQTKEKIYCPLCDKELVVLRSDDWTILHSYACDRCGFYSRFFYDYDFLREWMENK